MQKIVAYYRVSTRKQERSQLGLEGQKAAVTAFAVQHDSRVLAEYTEVETGKRADRPELTKALAHAKRAQATLVVAKLDRLARNVAFTSALMEDFLCCDNPHANRLTIHILAAVAEDEARRISERTKAALAAYKTRGGKLGAARPECQNLTAEARQKGARAGTQAVQRNADAAYADLRDLLAKLRPAFSYADIAQLLNDMGHLTRRGQPWTDIAVLRVCRRFQLCDALRRWQAPTATVAPVPRSEKGRCLRCRESSIEIRIPIPSGRSLTFRGMVVSDHRQFLNEARLSALAICLFLAGVALADNDTMNPDHPRFLVLDDASIGLDLQNRIPVLRILTSDVFKNHQIFLFTHDRVWFDLARKHLPTGSNWLHLELHANESAVTLTK